MRILIATGIFEPEAGGPATYAPQIAAQLAQRGCEVDVITYSKEPRYDFDASYPFRLVRLPRMSGVIGKIVNRFRFFALAMRLSKRADIIYSLDWFAAGAPVAVAAALRRVPFVLRIGGDYAWEQVYLESGAQPMTLKAFYESGRFRRGLYLLIFYLVRFVLRRARLIIFNTQTQRDLYVTYFGIPQARTSVIDNPLPDAFKDIKRSKLSHEIVFWGRFNVMKNAATLIQAFAQAALPETFHLTLIGDGPERTKLLELIRDLRLAPRVKIINTLRLHDVLDRVKNARAFVLPSWTDISPSQVYEALSVGVPGIVTKENYLPIREKLPLTIDPASVDDIAQKLQVLADESSYQDFSKRFSDIRFEHSWTDVAGEHEKIFADILGRKSKKELRILQIGADRSPRGILHPESAASARQKAYGEQFGSLDIIGFSLRSDKATAKEISANTRVYPTNSLTRIFYGFDALRLASKLPKPDVISVQDPFEAGLVAAVLSSLFRAPLHVQVHADFLSPGYSALSTSNWIRAVIARLALRRARRIRVVSERIKNTLISKYHLQAPVTVLPIYVDLQRFAKAKAGALSEKYPSYARKLLVVARLEPEKNVSLAIRAFAAAAPKDTCLIIVGEGSEKGRLTRLAEELGVIERVSFESAEDVAAYYALADLVLVPSKYEGYGMVIVEALAAGKPVISTDVGIAKDAGAIVTTPETFSEALQAWFEHAPKSMALSGYPYDSFDSYVRAYTDDVAQTANS